MFTRRNTSKGSFPSSGAQNPLGSFPSAANENIIPARHRTRTGSSDASFGGDSFVSLSTSSQRKRQGRFMKIRSSAQQKMQAMLNHRSSFPNSTSRMNLHNNAGGKSSSSISTVSTSSSASDHLHSTHSQQQQQHQQQQSQQQQQLLTGFEALDNPMRGTASAFDFTPLITTTNFAVDHTNTNNNETDVDWMESLYPDIPSSGSSDSALGL